MQGSAFSILDRAAGLAAVVFLLSAVPAAAERLYKYTVAIDPELSTLSVRACFDGVAPPTLSAESLDATLALIDIRVEGSRKSIQPSGSVSLKSVPENGCVLYRVNVSQPIRQHDRTGDKIHHVGKDLLTSVGIWLWRPETLEADEDIEVTFVLPDGIAVSTPWRPVALSADRAVFRTGRSPYDWPASVAFGRFREREIRVGGARLRLTVLDAAPAADVEQIQAWIRDSAQMVADLYGRFPQSQAQIVVAPGARGNEPTPWAYVARGGSPAAHFFINQRRPINEFFEDWTAVHELSHLLLPYVNADDIWLSEGVATYYQNVLRARGGRMTASEAWQRLHAGFVRGMQSAPGLTLAQATESMYRDGTYMRVYWEGAALLLMADVRLRQMTIGKQSLDTALAALNDCCAATDRAWSARELFDKLDAVTGTGVFREIYDQHVASRNFPDLSQTYRALGVAIGAGGIELSTEPKQRRMRDAIMATGVPDVSEIPAD
jgi:M61 glycyl aminopeptidase